GGCRFGGGSMVVPCYSPSAVGIGHDCRTFFRRATTGSGNAAAPAGTWPGGPAGCFGGVPRERQGVGVDKEVGEAPASLPRGRFSDLPGERRSALGVGRDVPAHLGPGADAAALGLLLVLGLDPGEVQRHVLRQPALAGYASTRSLKRILRSTQLINL